MGGPPRFATVEIPYAFKLLQQELAAMSIGTLLRVEGGEEDERWFDADEAVLRDDDRDSDDAEVHFGEGEDEYSGNDSDDNGGEDFGDGTLADAAGDEGDGDDL